MIERKAWVSEHPIEQLFATRMRQERRRRGLTQLAFSMQLGIDQAAVVRMEKNADRREGARRITLGEAQTIADALGVQLDELLRPEAPGPLSEQLAAAETELKSAQAYLERTIVDVEVAARKRDMLRAAMQTANPGGDS